MPAAADIYSLIRAPQQQAGPLDNYSAMMQLRAMGDSSALHALQMQKLQGDLTEEDAFKSKIADWVKAGAQGDLPVDAYAASPSRAAAFDKNRLEGKKLRGEVDKNTIEIHGKQVQQLRDQLATVADDNGLMALRENATKLYGPKAAESIPASVSAPGFEEWRRGQLMTADKLLEYKNPKYDFKSDGKEETLWQVNPNAGKVGPIEGAPKITKQMSPAEADTAKRGWAQLGQPTYDEQRGVWVMRPNAAAPAAAPAAPAAAPAVAPGAAPAAPAAAAAPAPAPTAGPAVIKPAGLPPRTQDVHALRVEFNALPEVKAYRDIIPVVEASRSAPNTRAGDLQLAYAAGKVLDPNSVVREGEFKMAEDVAAPQAKLWNQVKSAAMGTGRMSPEVRAELVSMLDNAVDKREGAYKAAETTYRGIAEKSGIPVDQVIITPQARGGQPAAEQPSAPKMFDKMPDASQYNGRRMQADDGTVYQSDGKRWVRQARTAK